jgi:hypothetical protein
LYLFLKGNPAQALELLEDSQEAGIPMGREG